MLWKGLLPTIPQTCSHSLWPPPHSPLSWQVVISFSADHGQYRLELLSEDQKIIWFQERGVFCQIPPNLSTAKSLQQVAFCHPHLHYIHHHHHHRLHHHNHYCHHHHDYLLLSKTTLISFAGFNGFNTSTYLFHIFKQLTTHCNALQHNHGPLKSLSSFWK